MQQQAKALADPSRFRMFQHVLGSDAQVGVAELRDLLGFNTNAIRQHLAVLTAAGLLAEFDEVRTVRGRPRKQYRVRADALHAFGSVSGSYERLAGLLLEVATSGDSPYDVGFRSTMAVPPTPATGGREPDQLLDDLFRELLLDGFEPEIIGVGAAALGNCPFADVATEEPGIVCELHRGLIDRFLSERADGVTVDLRPHEPHRAGCEVVLTGLSR